MQLQDALTHTSMYIHPNRRSTRLGWLVMDQKLFFCFTGSCIALMHFSWSRYHVLMQHEYKLQIHTLCALKPLDWMLF
jgi:hypothetical protein